MVYSNRKLTSSVKNGTLFLGDNKDNRNWEEQNFFKKSFESP